LKRASHALSRGNPALAAILVAQSGLQKLDADERITFRLFAAEKLLDAGVDPPAPRSALIVIKCEVESCAPGETMNGCNSSILRRLPILLNALCLVVAASSCATGTETRQMNRSDAIDVARAYIASRMPEFDFINTKNYDGFVIDEGSSWGVGFMPTGVTTTGGTPEFTVDKKSMAVIKVKMAQ
jgi:hypothetical protein